MKLENLRLLPAQTTELGPARVLQVSEGRILLEFHGRTEWAVAALVHVYQPVVGDTVLSISQGGSCYVIGVIQGTGKVSLTAPGDVDICAPRGEIRLMARKGVHIKGMSVTLSANTLEITARSVMERFTDATRWVKEALQIRAGRVRMSVDSDYRVTADRIIERANGDVKIDGNKIHLG